MGPRSCIQTLDNPGQRRGDSRQPRLHGSAGQRACHPTEQGTPPRTPPATNAVICGRSSSAVSVGPGRLSPADPATCGSGGTYSASSSPDTSCTSGPSTIYSTNQDQSSQRWGRMGQLSGHDRTRPQQAFSAHPWPRGGRGYVWYMALYICTRSGNSGQPCDMCCVYAIKTVMFVH